MNLSGDAIERLRRDLPTIRNVAGWSAEHLAELLGVSRVTVVTLENTENKMSRMQYLAIRALLQNEIETNQNEALKDLLEFMVDRDNVSERDRQEIRDSVGAVAKKVGRKAGSAAVSSAIKQTVADIAVNEIAPELVTRGARKITEILIKHINK